jgi:hypothetical protein
MSDAETTELTNQNIIDAVREEGSIAAVARKAQLAPSTLKDRIAREGIKDEVEQARDEHTRALLADQEEDDEAEGIPEVEVLRQRLKDHERRQREQRQEDVAEERLYQRLEGAISRARVSYDPPTISDRERRDPHQFLALFSDTHAGEVVDAEATLGMNEYDWEVMMRRMQKFQKSIISYQRNRPYPIRVLNVALLGDMLSGDIHDELQITNDRTIDEAVVDLSFDISAWLEAFIPHFERINVIGVPGNHPRRARKPQAKLQHNNADWLLYRFIESRLESYKTENDEPIFSWNFPRSSYAVAQLAQDPDQRPGGWRFLFMHGDGIRTTMPGVPWGGVVRRVTTLEQQFSKAGMPIDYVALGHFHTVNALDGVGTKTFLNGSVKGVDEYSLNQFGSGRPPTQTLLTLHPRNGVTDLSYIDLEPTHPAADALRQP